MLESSLSSLVHYMSAHYFVAGGYLSALRHLAASASYYDVPFKFTGKIDKLTFKLEPEQDTQAKR